jgi:endonuclease/exonuclease/phosphatase family metal-dependent hydrolase
MRLTSWNLLHGMPIPPESTIDSVALLASEISQLAPDVIGLQEVDLDLARSGTRNQVADVAAVLGAKHWAFAPSLMGSPDEDWRKPHNEDALVVTADSQTFIPGYGIGIVSKIPVISWHRLELRHSPIGMPMSWPVDGKLKHFYVRDHPRSALGAVLDNGWLVINAHLSFVPFFNFFQLMKIKKWANKLPITDKKKILIMGDFNIPFGIFVRGINWNSLASQKTFPSFMPRVQIDYFLSQKVASEDVVHIPSVHKGMSDHLSLTIEVE